MTRRALRPMTSAAAGAAPVISKAEGLPCGAFGSITVLIFSNCLSRARGGREATILLGSRKNCGANRAPSCLLLGYFVAGLAGRRAGPRAREAPGVFRHSERLIPNGAKNTPGRFACQEE